jgi:hypothetical protein
LALRSVSEALRDFSETLNEFLTEDL